MGFAKRQLEKGALVHAEGIDVCPAHFEDDDLAALAKRKARPCECSYCGRQGSAPLEEIVVRILASVSLYYGDAAGVLPYDGREGGYQGPTYDTLDLLEGTIGLELAEDEHQEPLRDDIVESIGDIAWTDDPRAVSAENLTRSWQQCCEKLRHGVRYFISEESGPSDDFGMDSLLAPPEILKEVMDLCTELGLITELPAGTRLYRAREQLPNERFRTPLTLGPPPPGRARAGRMSAAGIPVFYGAFKRRTALLETASRTGTLAVGVFRTVRALRIVDLTAIPPMPGFFSAEAAQREGNRFLRDFAKDISKPLERDERIHFEYVPSQVITEYLRFRFKPGGQRIDGIRYSSAQHAGGSSIALFCTRANLVLTAKTRKRLERNETTISGEEPWLKLVSTSQATVKMRPVIEDDPSSSK